ncbi:MAG: PaaI family thioesterase [Thermoplasmatota archaeon]
MNRPAAPAPPGRHLLRPIPEVRRCFGCGPDNPDGLRLDFYLEADRVEGRWTPTGASEGWQGLLHGGITAALHDDAAHWAMVALACATGFTTRMDVRYTAPIRLGHEVLATGRIQELGPRRGHFATTIHQDGVLASSAVVEYALMDAARSRAMMGGVVSDDFARWLDADAAGRLALLLERGRLEGEKRSGPPRI